MQRNKHKHELQKSDAEGTDMENVIKLDVGRLRQITHELVKVPDYLNIFSTNINEIHDLSQHC